MRVLVSGLIIFLAACSGETAPDAPATTQSQSATLNASAEATSLLGEELHQIPGDSATVARQLEQLQEAENAFEADGGTVESFVWLGRRTAYLTRYREAIDIYSQGLEAHPDSPHLLRHRGHRYMSVRQFDNAIEDFERAAELTDGLPDEVEPDGQPNAAGIPTSTLQTNIWYHLALAHYYKGDFQAAAAAMQTCYDLAGNNDMKIAAADWLYMAYRRAGMETVANAAIAWVTPDLEILENHSYHRRILMYRGLVEPGELLGEGTALDMATQGYGVGNWYLMNGDEERARSVFRQVLETGYWPAFGYIAAEAELARMGA